MSLPRSSGILLHPTSLPGPFGVGDLGPAARAWVDTLAGAGQTWWQVLPVNPTGYGDSPYQSPSTFAGNLNLISPELLAQDGLAGPDDVRVCEVPAGAANFEAVIPNKRILVRQAWDRFTADGAPDLRAAFDAFRVAESRWLDDFALFMALKNAHDGAPWWEWPRRLAHREPAALRAESESFAEEVAANRFGQFLFFRQWAGLRGHARKHGVNVIGDLPIYVAHDSADVWAHPELFLLDADRTPTAVAGVPPDYFSTTGQLWGNPIYDWEAHRRTRYAWWVDRLRAALRLYDLIRFDHFRGLAGYWAVPFGDPTAEYGEWRPGPGASLLEAVRAALGGVPLIAEDLGVITPDVDALRTQFGLPGMRILQFAFGGAVESRFRPHRFTSDAVVYTGTHDNDTTRGWFEKLTAAEREQFARYVPGAEQDPVWALIRLGWASVADLALIPLQDVLDLGSAARLNTPGTPTGNWRWRAREAELIDHRWVTRLRDLTQTYERQPATGTT